MEAKKTTVLLTVIAVATLLVAVVGATFAFFAVQADVDQANVGVETTTAEAADSFVATSTGELSLPVTNDVMQPTDEDVVAVSDDATINVKLKAGSGHAKCTYNITYTKAAGSDDYTPTVADRLEYTIKGSATYGAETINLESAEDGSNKEVNMDKVSTFGPFTIEDDADEADTETEQVWTLTATFYNLAIDQAENDEQEGQTGKTFKGNFTVTGVSCENTATAE